MSTESPQEAVKPPQTLVAEKLSDEKLVLNKGRNDGLKLGQRFLIFGYGKEVIDPATNESLGKLEIVRGTGKVVHVQDRLSTVESDMRTSSTKTIRKSSPSGFTISTLLNPVQVEEEIGEPIIVPFTSAQRGDVARQI